jgi:uncharacterized DUF497 family protein
MNNAEYDWDFENLHHIARHNITPEEAEYALSGYTVEVEVREEEGELRIMELGITASGRILFLAWTPRGRRVRVVTALDPSATLKKLLLSSGGRSNL